MMQEHTLETRHGMVKYSTATCENCESAVIPEDTTEISVGSEDKVFCSYCTEEIFGMNIETGDSVSEAEIEEIGESSSFWESHSSKMKYGTVGFIAALAIFSPGVLYTAVLYTVGILTAIAIGIILIFLLS